MSIHRTHVVVGLGLFIAGLAGISCSGGSASSPPANSGGAGTGGATFGAGTGPGGAVSLGGAPVVTGCTSDKEIVCSTGGATPGTGGASLPAGGGTPPAVGETCVPSPDAGTPIDFPGSTVLQCACSNPVNIPTDSFKPCKMTGCHAAHCVPKNILPPGTPLDLLGVCEDTTTVCVPDDYVKTYDRFLPKKCVSLEGAEGRCISTCIPQVNGLMDVLPKADCGDNERCAPCFNPNDGTDTHACSQGCDTGPSPTTTAHPTVFDKCGKDLGVCVPKAIVPAVLLTELPPDTCTKTGYVCAPVAKTQNLKYNFPQCTPSDGFVTVLQQFATSGGPNVGKLPSSGQIGGCVPSFLITANMIEALFLAADGCKDGETCAPCDNPLRGNTSTGACPVPLPSDDGGGLPPAGSTTSTGGAGGATAAAGGAGGAP